jgi:large subunit ribosomal protein L15
VKSDINIINLQDLDQKIPHLLDTGQAEKKGNRIIIDVGALGIEKVLGKGMVTHTLDVTADRFSQSAKEKIQQAGGTIHARS